VNLREDAVSPRHSLFAQKVGVLACSLAHSLQGRAQPELLVGKVISGGGVVVEQVVVRMVGVGVGVAVV